MFNSYFILISTGILSFAIIYFLSYILFKYAHQIYRFSKSILKSIVQALRKNEYIANFFSKHPKLIKFCKERTNRHSFWGLNASLLSLIFIYLLFAFLGLIEDFINSGPIVNIDIRFNNLLLLFRSEYYIKTFLFITTLGKWEIIISALLVLSIIFLLWHKKEYLISLWISVLGSSIVNYLSKLAFARPRPELAVYTEKTFSFPSGHATIAISFYAFLIYLLIRNSKKILQKSIFFVLGLIIVIALGFSRLYLGVHYLSDVLGGYLLGGLWLIIAISFLEWKLSHSKKQTIDKNRKHNSIKLISICLILGQLIFMLYFASHYNPRPQKIVQTKVTTVNNVFSLINNSSLDHYSKTISALKQEPLSFIISASNDKSLISGFEKSGWLLANQINDDSLIKAAQAALLNKPYPRGPMTPSFWNTKTNDFGFDKATASHSIRQREHARFWKTNIRTKDNKTIYVGIVSLDSGLKWGGITHRIAPDIDTERERLFKDLKNAQIIKESKKEKFVPPLLGQNFTGDQFFTDGQTYFLDLK